MTLYNKKGKAVAYIENDVIWTFDGRAVAYLFQEAVYNIAFYSPLRHLPVLQDHLWKQLLQSMQKRLFHLRVQGK